jgi:hypothetical protein
MWTQNNVVPVRGEVVEAFVSLVVKRRRFDRVVSNYKG